MKSGSSASLTERILAFQRTGADGEAILSDVARRVYEYPKRKYRWDEDASSEFFVRVYPKIRGLIERFRYMGRPFESYLTSTLMFQIRSFAQEQKRKDLEWEVSACPALWSSGAAASGVGEAGGPGAARSPVSPGTGRESEGSAHWWALDPPLREALGISAAGRMVSPASRRRFLILCLKSAHVLSDGDLEAISRIVECPLEVLEDQAERLRERGRRKLGRVELFTGRRNRAYHGLRVLEARLGRETDPEQRASLERRYAHLSSTVRGCQRIIARIGLGPSHREIAEVLGIPKPTVDSTIHRLKLRAAGLYARRHAEYA